MRGEHHALWKITIPALAYTHSAIRQGLLTAAALCMHYHSLSDPILANTYLEAAESNGDRFVAESTQQARRFDPGDFDSIFTCSRLLTVLGFGFHRIHRANGVTLGDPTAWTWLHLLRGVKPVYTAMLDSGHDIDPSMSLNMGPEIPGTQSHGPRICGMHSHRSHS